MVYLGGTSIRVLENKKANSFYSLRNNSELGVKIHAAETIFIHPLLGTKEVGVHFE